MKLGTDSKSRIFHVKFYTAMFLEKNYQHDLVKVNKISFLFLTKIN